MTARRFFMSTVREGVDTPILPNESDLAAVYSLRKINPLSTLCLKVIRSSDSATLDIGWDGDVVDMAAIDTFCTGTTGKVHTWYDQYSSITATQTNTLYQPVIYESGAVLLEGSRPTMRWPSRSSLEFSSVYGNIQSAFFVYKLTAVQFANVLLYRSAAEQVLAGGTVNASITGFTLFNLATIRSSNISENTNYNLSSFFLGTDQLIDTNSSDSASISPSISSYSLWVSLGRNGNALSVNGKMHEVILYSTSQFSEKDIIENNINDYYSIY